VTGPAPERLLVDEHAAVVEPVTTLAATVLDALGSGRWPRTELERLVDLLQHDLLVQAAQEERVLFPRAGGSADDRIRHLIADHEALRMTVGRVADLAGGPTRDAGRLGGVIGDLLRLLDRHLVREERVLATVTLDGVGTPNAG
jgi:Hemerythrin HHE cation binding domain